MIEAIVMFFDPNNFLHRLLLTLLVNVLVTAIGLFIAFESSKRGRPPLGVIGYVLLAIGAISLLFSIFFDSSILAFIGLGLTLWGALLTYVKSNNYVKAVFINSMTFSSLKAIDEILNELEVKGKAVYLPTRDVEKPNRGEVFISKKKGSLIIPKEGEPSEGIYITSPGADLADLYEKRLGKEFIEADLEYLKERFPKLFIEDLEIAEDLEMNVEDNRVEVKIEGNIHWSLCKKISKLERICNSIGCPLCSSIAIALARASGKPVAIGEKKFSKKGDRLEIEYLILEA